MIAVASKLRRRGSGFPRIEGDAGTHNRGHSTKGTEKSTQSSKKA